MKRCLLLLPLVLGSTAYGAIATLSAAPEQALGLIGQRLRAATALRPLTISQWIGDQDSSRFAVWQPATLDLSRLDYVVRPALPATLEARPSLEVRRRIEALLSKLEKEGSETLRLLRRAEILERIGTPEARELLKAIAREATTPNLAREAKEAIGRLSPREPNLGGHQAERRSP
jgi:hypothetical protein